jgi:hypothetical protein
MDSAKAITNCNRGLVIASLRSYPRCLKTEAMVQRG